MFRTNRPALEARLNDRLKAISTRAAAPPEIEVATPPSRRRERKSTFRQGVLILALGERLPVVIKNLSDSGARVEFFQNTKLAGHARLMEQSLGLDRHARIVWQRQGQVGLKFI